MASGDDENALTLFEVDEQGHAGFEVLGRANGARYWTEADLMNALGYQGAAAFRKVITKAMQSCLSSGIQTEENFRLDPETGSTNSRGLVAT